MDIINLKYRLEKQIEKIDEEIESLKNSNDSFSSSQKAMQIKNSIKNYISKRNNVLLKITKLSNGILFIQNNRIYGQDRKPFYNINKDNVFDVVNKAAEVIDHSLQEMSRNGIDTNNLRMIGNALNIVYICYDNVDSYFLEEEKINQLRINDQIKSLNMEKKDLLNQIEALRPRLANIIEKYDDELKKAQLQKIEYNNTLADDISLPIGVYQDEVGINTFLKWDVLKDNVLTIDASDSIDQMSDIITTLCMNFLLSYKGFNKRFHFSYDEDNIGLNLLINNLTKTFDKDIYSSQVEPKVIDSNDINQNNRFLTSIINEREILFSQNKEDNIFEYNKKHEDSILPLHLVFLFDYPHAYLNNSKKYDFLFKNAAKNGLFVVAIKTNNSPLSEFDDYSDSSKCGNINITLLDNNKLLFNEKEYNLIKINSQGIDETLNILKEEKKVSNGIQLYEKVGFGLFTSVKNDVSNVISIPVGIIDNKVKSFEFCAKASNTEKYPIAYIINGNPNTGKSSAIDALIFNGAMKYSPDDLNFYLIDFKDGVSSEKYLTTCKIPHIKYVAGGSKQEDAEIILKALDNLKEERNNIFKELGIDNIVKYNDLNENNHMPRIIVAIDECQKIFKDDGDVSSRVNALTNLCENLVKQGRSAGIHLIFSSQAPDSKMMDRISKFAEGRVCFNCSSDDARLILGNEKENAEKLLRECIYPGTALISEDSGKNCKKIVFSYYGEDEKAIEYAKQICKKWTDYKFDAIKIGEVKKIYALDYFKMHDSKELLENENIPFGEDYFTHKPAYFKFNESTHSLMTFGENSFISSDILTSIIIKALHDKSEIKLLDASKKEILFNRFAGNNNIKFYKKSEYLSLLKELNDEANKRMNGEYNNVQYVIINGLSAITQFINDEQLIESKLVYDENDTYAELKKAYAYASNSSSSENIYGQKTFLNILKSKLRNTTNLYLIFTIDRYASIQRFDSDISENVELKVYHSDNERFMENMSYVAGNSISKTTLRTCNPNLVLYSIKQSTASKVSYFRYNEEDAYMILKGDK